LNDIHTHICSREAIVYAGRVSQQSVSMRVVQSAAQLAVKLANNWQRTQTPPLSCTGSSSAQLLLCS
jgi:hypothetical protein